MKFLTNKADEGKAGDLASMENKRYGYSKGEGDSMDEVLVGKK